MTKTATFLRMVLLVPWLAPTPVAAQEGRLAPNGMGFEVEATDEVARTAAGSLPAVPAGSLVLARVSVPWSALEAERGKIDLTVLGSLVTTLGSSGYRVMLEVRGDGHPWDVAARFPSASDAPAQAAWLALSQEIARQHPIDLFAFPLGWAAGATEADVSYLVKKTAVQATGIRPGARFVLTGVSAETLPIVEKLFASDVASYVDAYEIDGSAAGIAETRRKLEALLGEADAGAEIFMAHLAPDGDGPGAAMKPALRALGEGYGAATVAVPAAELATAAGNLGLLRAALSDGLAAVPGGAPQLLATSDRAPVAGGGAVAFVDAKSLDTIVAWWGAAVAPAAILKLATSDVGRPTLTDPLGKKEPALLDFGRDAEARTAAAGVPLRPYPLLARFPREVSRDVSVEPVKVDVSGEEELPVAEILARFQRFQADQDERLQNFVADERIILHYEVSAGTVVDVISDNVFYFEKGGPTEWRETAFYVNGVRWRWGDRPKLPLIQPEKVATIPLQITLGKEFDYELEGRDVVDGRSCYVVAFEPRDAAKSAYRGRVWIDRKLFARVQMSVVQTNLVPPVISNTETDLFRPVDTPSGPIWLVHRIDGQQLFSIGGTSTPVVREVDFSRIRVNDPTFREERDKSYASSDIMFRETGTGYRYLDVEDGKRVVNEKDTKSSLLGAAGAFYTQDYDYPLPLLGVNYFNFDLFGKGAQLNVFFAGVLATVTLNKPDLWGKCQLSADVIGIFIPSTDRVHLGDEERPQEDVEVMSEVATVRLGIPFAEYFRVNAWYVLNAHGYGEADDTADDFILPQDHLEHELSLGIEFKRSGFRASLDGSFARRSKWELWGHPDGRDFDPEHDSYVTGDLTVAKDFYLPKFMRLHVDASLQTGERLDRFSKFSFGYFSNRIRGFAGSGVRYDQGANVRAAYGFNAGDVIRLDANFDYAVVRDRDVSDDTLKFYGVGISGTLVGPWKTIINLDYGYGLHSDIAGLEHESEYRLVILKLFK